MDTLDGVRRLFGRAKDEPVHAIDVVERVRVEIGSLEIEPPPRGPIVWKVSAAVSTLAAVLPLILIARTYLALDDLTIEFLLPAQGVWLW
jgi:hypothetical protein